MNSELTVHSLTSRPVHRRNQLPQLYALHTLCLRIWNDWWNTCSNNAIFLALHISAVYLFQSLGMIILVIFNNYWIPSLWMINELSSVIQIVTNQYDTCSNVKAKSHIRHLIHRIFETWMQIFQTICWLHSEFINDNKKKKQHRKSIKTNPVWVRESPSTQSKPHQ